MMFFRNRRQTTQPNNQPNNFLIFFFQHLAFLIAFFDTIIALLGHPFHKEMFAYFAYVLIM